MAIVRVSGAYNGTNAGSTVLQYTPDPGAEANDLFLAFIALNSAQNVTTPSGWTPLQNFVHGETRFCTYQKISTGGEVSASFNTVGNINTAGWGIWLGYRGASRDISSGQGTGGNTTVTAPSLTPSSTPSRLVSLFRSRTIPAPNNPPGTRFLSLPAGMSEAARQDGGFALRVGEQNLVGTAPTGTRVSNIDGGVADIYGWSVLLKELDLEWSLGSVQF